MLKLLLTIWSLGFRSVVANWRRSMAAMLSVGLAFVAVMALDGYVRDVRGRFESLSSRRNMLGDVVVTRVSEGDAWPENLGVAEQELIQSFLTKERDKVRNVVRKLYFSGVITNGKTSTVGLGYGLDAESGARLRGPAWAWNTVAGTPLHRAPGESVVVSRGLARLLGCTWSEVDMFDAEGGYRPDPRALRCERGDVQLQAYTGSRGLNAIDANVVGVIDPGTRKYDERYVVGPLPLIQDLMGTKEVSAYSIELVEGADPRAFSTRLAAEARARGILLEAGPWDEGPYGSFFRAVVGFLSAFKTFVLVVLGFVAVMSIMNTLSRNVVERIPEIGSLRSIGFLRRHIAGIFAVEGFVLALFACAVSSLVVFAASFLLDRAHIQYAVGIASVPLPLKLSISPIACLSTAAILCVAAVLGALGPARRASRLNIGEALRHV